MDKKKKPKTIKRQLKAGKQKRQVPPELLARRWQPGQSGNPKGRPPKEFSITAQLRLLGEEGGGWRYKKLAAIVWRRALVIQDPWAIQFLVERIEGKPRQSVDNDYNLDEVKSAFGEMVAAIKVADTNPN